MDDLRNEVDLIYTAIGEKFNPHTTFTCKKFNEEKQYSIWYARVACMTANQNRIMAAIVPLEVFHTLDSTSPLDQLRWIGFQTRETTDQALLASLPLQSCVVRPQVSAVSQDALRKVKFNVVAKGETAWSYLSRELPSLRIDLLRDKSTQEFLGQGTLEQCLDIFQTCLAFIIQP